MEAKRKWTLALGILGALVVAAIGIFRTVGCEEGATISKQVDDALKALSPDVGAPLEPDAGAAEPPSTVTTEPGSIILRTSECGEIEFSDTLIPGDRGPQVRALQTWLNCEGEPIEVDGIYGTGTAEAVAIRLGEPSKPEPKPDEGTAGD